METGIKGNATEAAVLQRFVTRGLEVLIPFGSGHPYDLVLHLGNGLFARVQCKTGRPVDDCVVFNSRCTDHGSGRVPYTGLADIFGVYFPPLNEVYVVPVLEASGFAPRLRLRKARNNQRRGVRFAADYLIDRWSIDSLRAVVLDGPSDGLGQHPLQLA